MSKTHVPFKQIFVPYIKLYLTLMVTFVFCAFHGQCFIFFGGFNAGLQNYIKHIFFIIQCLTQISNEQKFIVNILEYLQVKGIVISLVKAMFGFNNPQPLLINILFTKK